GPSVSMIRPSKSKTRARTGGGPGEAEGGDGTGTFSGQPRTRFHGGGPSPSQAPLVYILAMPPVTLGASPPRREDPRLLTGRGRGRRRRPGRGRRLWKAAGGAHTGAGGRRGRPPPLPGARQQPGLRGRLRSGGRPAGRGRGPGPGSVPEPAPRGRAGGAQRGPGGARRRDRRAEPLGPP